MSDFLKKSLITIAQEVLALEQALIESGGLITEEIEQSLMIKDLELPTKVDGYASILKRIDVTADHFRAQAAFFTQVAKGIDNAYDRLKENLKTAMEIMGTDEVKGHNYRLKMSRSKPAVIIDHLSKIPGEFLITETITSPDKKKICSHMESGGTVAGVRLESKGSLRMYPNKE